MKFIDALADALDRAYRFGGPVDEPEMTRHIKVSDTLARQWADRLREDPLGEVPE